MGDDVLKSKLLHIDGKQSVCMAFKCKLTGFISNIFITPLTFSGAQAGLGNPEALCHLLFVSFELNLSSRSATNLIIK